MTRKIGRVPPGTGLSQAEPEEGLGPPDFDPSRGMRCECQNAGVLNPAFASWYDPELELPFVNHAPGECACTNDLAKYRSSGGAIRWLCSCCNTFGDVRLSDSDRSGEAIDPPLGGSTEGESAGLKGIAQPQSGRTVR